MSAADFEIGTRLRAGRLTVHDPPDVRTEGEAVTLEREQTRNGLPERLEAGGRYDEVEVGKQLLGRMPRS
jgi:hypothetical protein